MKSLFKVSVAALMLSQLEASYYNNEKNLGDQWEFNADFLWWEIVEDSLTSVVVVNSETANNISTKVHNPNFKWDPGVRLGLGFQPCGCNWDIYASWTYFNTKARHHFSSSDPANVIIPQWGSLLPFVGGDIDTHWHLNLNWADLQLNQSICENSCFSFDIHGGLRGVFIDQKFIFTGSNAVASNSVHSKHRFSSIGVALGLDASWMLGCGISLNVCGGGALLYGKNDSSLREVLTVTDEDFISGSSHYHISRAMSDFSIGISWENDICDCMNLVLGVNWEHHILFNQNQLPRGSLTSAARPRDGDITMQGLTVSATLTY